MGYVLSTPVVPEFLTGWEFVKFFQEINAGKDPSGRTPTTGWTWWALTLRTAAA